VARREYGQFCGLARALELVGERWALLIVRDLLVGARRYSDLRRGLPRIPTNILAQRLKELEASGIVRRRLLPRPDGPVVYELTEHGADLEPAVVQLSRWGARSLGYPRPGEIVTSDSLVMALRTTFRPDGARGLRARFELRLGDIVVHASVGAGRVTAQAGPAVDPDLVIETGPALSDLLAGKLTPAKAVRTGTVRLTGDAKLLDRFVAAFPIR
jgi:DNA-binding HxlR family transcriptional regulator/putative sterol carrier protein